MSETIVNGKVVHVDKWIIYDHEEAIRLEYRWYKFALWVRDHPAQYPNGFHHQGMFWADIYSVVDIDQYKPEILKVTHQKLGPYNIQCLRKVRDGKRIYWVHSLHREGHCPGCKPPILKRRGPEKLIRRSAVGGGQESGPPKLIRRSAVAEVPKLIRRQK